MNGGWDSIYRMGEGRAGGGAGEAGHGKVAELARSFRRLGGIQKGESEEINGVKNPLNFGIGLNKLEEGAKVSRERGRGRKSACVRTCMVCRPAVCCAAWALPLATRRRPEEMEEEAGREEGAEGGKRGARRRRRRRGEKREEEETLVEAWPKEKRIYFSFLLVNLIIVVVV